MVFFRPKHEALSIGCQESFVSHLTGGNIPEREAHPEVTIDKKKPLRIVFQGLLLISLPGSQTKVSWDMAIYLFAAVLFSDFIYILGLGV